MTELQFEKFADHIDESGNAALIKSDVLEGLSRLPDETVDLVVTSPPYWTAVAYSGDNQLNRQTYEQYIDWLGAVWKDCYRVLRPNGKIVINTPVMPIPKSIINQTPRHIKNIASDIDVWLVNNSAYMRYGVFIWQKQTSKMMFGSYPHPPNIFENNTIEFMNVYVKPGKAKKIPAPVKEANKLAQYEWLDLTQQVWFMYPADVKRSLSHPAPFPNKLPARFIKMYTFGSMAEYPGDVVLDPFNGAGTTTCVAKMLGRRSIGIEMADEYHQMAKDRLRQTIWRQDLNWLVGRANHMTTEELESYKNEKENSPTTPASEMKKSRAERQHKKNTYGRGVPERGQPVQAELFSED